MKWRMDTGDLLGIKDYLYERGIRKLIHFTDERNLRGILKYGLLSIRRLDEMKLNYYFNDEDRFDGHLDYISLSITEPNYYLLKYFINKRRILNPIFIEINPLILCTFYHRIYCQTNAATKDGKKGSKLDNFKAMFDEVVSYQTSYGFETRTKTFDRKRLEKKLNQTTDIQAEILWYESVPYEYINNIIFFDGFDFADENDFDFAFGDLNEAKIDSHSINKILTPFNISFVRKSVCCYFDDIDCYFFNSILMKGKLIWKRKDQKQKENILKLRTQVLRVN